MRVKYNAAFSAELDKLQSGSDLDPGFIQVRASVMIPLHPHPGQEMKSQLESQQKSHQNRKGIAEKASWSSKGLIPKPRAVRHM